MRNPNRLNAFYGKLNELHKEYLPDWRVGQLWCNFAQWLYDDGVDMFLLEDDAMLNKLKEFFGEK